MSKATSGHAVLHHGDGVGTDAEAHDIAVTLAGRPSAIRPLTTHGARIKWQTRNAPKPYLVRNWDILEESELLIASPAKAIEHLQSGIWPTVRCARLSSRRSRLHINARC